MTRIIGGTAGGRRLKTPSDATRPAACLEDSEQAELVDFCVEMT